MEINSKTAPIVQEKEQNQATLDLMHRMRLTGMAAAFEEGLTSTYAEAMTPDAFVSWLLTGMMLSETLLSLMPCSTESCTPHTGLN